MDPSIYFKMKYTLAILLLTLMACDKVEDMDTKKYPAEVTFLYAGQEVIYKVIKQDYQLDSAGNPLTSEISKLWLDRNLGAERAAVIFNDPLATGDLFQWGRPDDGHQLRTSDTTQTLSPTITPNHNKFISQPLGESDWLIGHNDGLWNNTENTNCPCPDGWRVPTAAELSMEMQSWETNNMEGAYNSPLKWVSAGNRDNHGTLRYEEFWAFMWSSTIDGNNTAQALAIIGSDVSEIITSPRIFGHSIRCIKDF